MNTLPNRQITMNTLTNIQTTYGHTHQEVSTHINKKLHSSFYSSNLLEETLVTWRHRWPQSLHWFDHVCLPTLLYTQSPTMSLGVWNTWQICEWKVCQCDKYENERRHTHTHTHTYTHTHKHTHTHTHTHIPPTHTQSTIEAPSYLWSNLSKPPHTCEAACWRLLIPVKQPYCVTTPSPLTPPNPHPHPKHCLEPLHTSGAPSYLRSSQTVCPLYDCVVVDAVVMGKVTQKCHSGLAVQLTVVAAESFALAL